MSQSNRRRAKSDPGSRPITKKKSDSRKSLSKDSLGKSQKKDKGETVSSDRAFPRALPKSFIGSADDSRLPTTPAAPTARIRSLSISDSVSPSTDESFNITFGRKIPNAILSEDIRTVQLRTEGNFTTTDVLKKIAEDFDVPLVDNDTEKQILKKLKDARVLNQDDFDTISAQVTGRKTSDLSLIETIAHLQSQRIDAEFSPHAILVQLAQDFEVAIDDQDTEQDIFKKLKKDGALNQSDYDFIIANLDPSIQPLREEALKRADQIANDTIENQIQMLEAAANKQKNSLLAAKTIEAKKALSVKHSRNLEQPQGSEKYKQAHAALKSKILELSGSDITSIDIALQSEITKLRTTGLTAEKQKQYKNFSDFLNSTDYHAFSLSALDVSGNFQEAADFVGLVKRKPNMQALISAEHYMLLNSCLKVLGEEMTSTILNRINPVTLAQFYTMGDDGLGLLSILHKQGGIADIKLRDVGERIANIKPLVKFNIAKTNLANLLVNHTIAEILTLTKALTKFEADQQIDILYTLRPHAVNQAALLAGLELANRLNWSSDNIQTQISNLPLNSSVEDIKNYIYAQALGVFDKNTQFSPWIKSLNLLMQEANYTLDVSASILLPGGTTFERICRIDDNAGNHIDSFVIHYHPGVAGAGVGSGYASNKHIKPVRGNTKTHRLYWDASIPDNLKKELPSTH
jgi:hypothetical protein